MAANPGGKLRGMAASWLYAGGVAVSPGRGERTRVYGVNFTLSGKFLLGTKESS
jgi:hypothetical protein